ncbi:MAG: type 1 glutamine amidotransferase [Pseudomonadota bacterium]
MPLHIGIIETGRPPEALGARHGSYPDMFERLLTTGADEADGALSFSTYAALDGDVPSDPAGADAWLITGSKHGVYEQLDWMHALEGFIRHVVDARVPVIGICFGHQIVATALGGRVVKSDRGWGVGHHTYTLNDAPDWLDGDEDDGQRTWHINAVHQDQVVDVPKGGKVIGRSDFCPNAIIAYGTSAFTMQPHPEFDDAFKRDLLEDRLRPIVPSDRIAAAHETLGNALDRAAAARAILSFIAYARAQTSAHAARPEAPTPTAREVA